MIWCTFSKLTPGVCVVQRVIDHLVIYEASIPRVDRAVRPSDEVALRELPADMVRPVARREAALPVSAHAFPEQRLLGVERGALLGVDDLTAVNAVGVDELEVGEVAVLRVCEVEVVAA